VAELHVELVSVEREIWSGEADMVIARTTEGELGVLAHHTPLLGQLAEGGVVRIKTGADEVVAAVHGGFLSVTEEGVTVLAEIAELAGDIDAARARSALERARQAAADDEEERAAQLRAQSRLRAVGESA
jgi:F-type H+-transporting ATPase subunit epsilon